MTDLSKLTAEELQDLVSLDASSSGERWKSGWDEIHCRLERLEKCEAALKQITGVPGNLPDGRLTTRTGPNDAVARGLMVCEARRIARAALEGR